MANGTYNNNPTKGNRLYMQPNQQNQPVGSMALNQNHFEAMNNLRNEY